MQPPNHRQYHCLWLNCHIQLSMCVCLLV
jgi:hypothetical protein